MLRKTRDALRERLLRPRVSHERPLGLSIDRFFALSGGSFYVSGWFRDEDASIVRFTAVSPEGARVEILENCFRYMRQDVNDFYTSLEDDPPKVGFIRTFQLPAKTHLATGWIFELESASGEAVEFAAPKPVTDFVKCGKPC